MERPDAVTYLNGRFESMIDAVKMRPTDDARGLGGAIDGALRDLGLGVTDEVPADSDARFTVLLRVNFLRHALERAAVLVDITVDEPQIQKRRSQLFTQIQATLKATEAEAAVVLAEPGEGELLLTRLNLDWIQDAPE